MAALWTWHWHWMLDGLLSTPRGLHELKRYQLQRNVQQSLSDPTDINSSMNLREFLLLTRTLKHTRTGWLCSTSCKTFVKALSHLSGGYMGSYSSFWRYIFRRPPTLFYGHYQYPMMDSLIQLRGLVHQQHHHHQSPFSQPTPRLHQSLFRSLEQRYQQGHMSLISTFVHHSGLNAMISYDTQMTDIDKGTDDE